MDQRSGLRRTLVVAGALALLAMVYVPMPMDHGHGGGYRLIFDEHNTGVAFFQLLLNVVFAALAGAILVNLSKRVFVAIGVCFVIAVAVMGETARVQYYWMRAQGCEGDAEGWLSRVNYQPPNEAALRAKEGFLNAASNWRLAWQFEKAKLAEARQTGPHARWTTVGSEQMKKLRQRSLTADGESMRRML